MKDVPLDVLEEWINAVGKEGNNPELNPPYAHGWRNAATAIQIKLDDWRRTHEQ